MRNKVEWKSNNYRIEETTSSQTGRSGVDEEWSGSTPTWIKIQEEYLRSEESQKHIRTPNPGFHCQEGESPKLLATKISED